MVTEYPIRVSNSELQTFKDCRRRWWLSYYRRLRPLQENKTGALALGSRVHNALDMYYSQGVPLLEAHKHFLDIDRAKLEAAFQDTSEIDSEGELGRIMLEGYIEWVEDNGIDAELEMISTEEIIEMPLMDGKVILQGKIDMRVRRKADGVRMFRDFKTVGGSFTDFTALAHMNEQILTYMMLETAQNQDGERSEGGIFTMLKKVKRSANARPPFYEQIEVRHNIFTLRNFWQRIHGTIQDLVNARDALDQGANHQFVVYPHPTRDCKWKCSFFAVCPLLDDGSAAEQAISESYKVADPYGYYNNNTEEKGSD
jgi:RecB family exonuclease